MYIKITNWEARRLSQILQSGAVKPEHMPWAQDLAGRINAQLSEQKQRKEVRNVVPDWIV